MKSPAKLLLFSLTSLAQAGEADLWITEVLPSTGEIEVTNVAEEFTTTRSLPFCHRFNYATRIPSGVTFAAGESRIFTVTFANQASSDLWLYRPGGFGNSANIISGLQWNTTSNIGRSSLASTVNLWNGGSSAAPAPAAGQSIQLTGDNPFSSENWTVGEPNLGTFREAPEPDAAPAISVQSDGDNLIINWQGGVPPYQLQSSNDLRDFTDLGEITTELTATVPITGDRQFFRVLSMAQPPQTARYRVTFSSLWSGLTFNSVPAEPTFGDLVGSTHNDQISFWSPGALASNGVAQLANTGSTLQLTSEVGLAIAGENADQIIVGPGIDQELGTSSFEITVNRDFPLLSLVSRLNDSPDWFTGVQNLDFLEDGLDFRDRIEVMLMPWDAGVDSGLGFGVPDSPTTPQASVQSLSDSASFLPSFFLGTDVGAIPLGGLIIERISEGE